MATDEQKDRSLLEFLDTSQLNCLNEAAQHPLRPILEGKVRNTSEKYLLSDADDQLLLNLHFNQLVRVRSIAIASSNVPQAPKSVKLMVNRSSIGFEDVEDAVEPAVAQVLDLTKEQVEEGQKIVLRFVRFQNVSSIHIFIESNQGEEDKTRIDSVDIFGTTVETTGDLKGLKSTQE